MSVVVVLEPAVFPNKDPQEVLDYAELYTNLLNPGIELIAQTVVVESASNSESPITLEVSNTALAISGATPPGIVDTVVWWLSGGTNDVTYVIKVTAQDNQVTPEDRIFVRRAAITVQYK
jgi:hypothetical protein